MSLPSVPVANTLGIEFFERPCAEVARALLGTTLRSTVDGVVTEGIIVETEAYLGPEDAASHAATKRGPTERNRAMFGPAGRLYVYFIYGMHWCLNVVAEPEGRPAAVLIRALDPTAGHEMMAQRRGRADHLCDGPGRLSAALGADGAYYGHDLSQSPIQLLAGEPIDDGRVATSARIGIRQAKDAPLRFFIRGNRSVSAR